MKLETIRLGRINFGDERFRISQFINPEALGRSIAASGLLNPPLLRAAGRRFVIVSGWKRILACRGAGIAEIPALVTDQKDDLKLFQAVVEENRTGRTLSLTEKAEIIKKSGATVD